MNYIPPALQLGAADTWQRLLQVAMEHRASDIHLEPHASGLTARVRIDGVLVAATHIGAAPIDAALKDSLRSYIKISASMDIAQQRLPQDGHWLAKLPNNGTQDCRIASMPTAMGEKLVIRLLANNSQCTPLAQLGYNTDQLATLHSSLRAPHGLILMTGPTGCGKTTSIYSALQTLDLAHINVCTIEDPVELLLTQVHQIQVNETAGLSFTAALRAILRQDPDVIVVGEIRDKTSAHMAVQAAQTGHLVISTLHANNAPQAITRLIHMGVAAVDLASSIQLITAQRLLRELCPMCKEPTALTPLQAQVWHHNGLAVPEFVYQPPHKPTECLACINGYMGRFGIYQMLAMTTTLGQACLHHGDEQSLQTAATQSGTHTLAHNALQRISQGSTSWQEALRHVTLEVAQ